MTVTRKADRVAPISQGRNSGLRGLEDGAFQHLVDGIAYGMVLLYIGQSAPTFPLTDHTPTKQQRNAEIRARYAKGETVCRQHPLDNFGDQKSWLFLRSFCCKSLSQKPPLACLIRSEDVHSECQKITLIFLQLMCARGARGRGPPLPSGEGRTRPAWRASALSAEVP
jgi:hypothetical protein